MTEEANPRIAAGGNMPPKLDAFSMALDDVHMTAKDYLDGKPIATQAEADAVGTILATARKIRSDADAARTEEKRPHLEAGRAVDAAWKPLADRCDNIITAAQRPLTAFLQAETDRQRAQAAEAAAEAARLVQEAAEARRGADGNLAAIEAAETISKQAEQATKAATRAGKQKVHVAGMGRAVGLRSSQVADVTDYRALLEHVMKTDPVPLKEWLADYARKALPAQLPGVSIRTETRAA